MAPCADQLPASLAASGSGGARHPGSERARCRARVDIEPAAVGACHGVRCGRRHRGDAVRHGDLARSPGQPPGRYFRRTQQDRCAAGSLAHPATGGCAHRGPAHSHRASAWGACATRVRTVCAAGSGRARRVRCTEPGREPRCRVRSRAVGRVVAATATGAAALDQRHGHPASAAGSATAR